MDIPYSNVSSGNLYVGIRGSNNTWWNWAANAYEAPTAFDVMKYCSILVADPFLSVLKSIIIPADAVKDPQATLIEFSSIGPPNITQCYQLGSQGVINLSFGTGTILRVS